MPREALQRLPSLPLAWSLRDDLLVPIPCTPMDAVCVLLVASISDEVPGGPRGLVGVTQEAFASPRPGVDRVA